MAEKTHFLDQNFNGFALKSAKVENLSSDPSGAGLYAGRVWFNTTDGLFKGYNGTAVITLSFSATYPGRFVGTIDASAGNWPTSGSGASGAIVDGDMWQVSNAGTIGSVSLNAMDLVVAKVDAASADADFAVVEQERTDLSPYSREEQQDDVDITANTELTVTAANLSKIRDIEVYRKLTGVGPNSDETRFEKVSEGIQVQLSSTDDTVAYLNSAVSLADARLVLQGTSA